MKKKKKTIHRKINTIKDGDRKMAEEEKEKVETTESAGVPPDESGKKAEEPKKQDREAAEEEAAAGEESVGASADGAAPEDPAKSSDEAKEPETPDKNKKAKDERSEEQKKLDELSERYLRTLAEYDNYRKRTQKEREAAYGDACADVLKQILPVMDMLEKAAQFGGDDKVSDGVRITLKAFEEALKRLGVEEIQALGEPFDPKLHNAVMHGEDEEKGENVVTDVFQKGYRRGDKIIRYAMFKVVN